MIKWTVMINNLNEYLNYVNVLEDFNIYIISFDEDEKGNRLTDDYNDNN